MTTERTATLEDERIAQLLPLISEAWSDGELTDLEIAAVCMALIRHGAPDLSCRNSLQGWLDPANPPTADDLQALRSRIAA